MSKEKDLLPGLPGGVPIIQKPDEPRLRHLIVDEPNGKTALPWVAVAAMSDTQVDMLAEIISQKVYDKLNKDLDETCQDTCAVEP